MKRNYALRQYWISINVEDVSSFDEGLAEKLYKAPSDFLPLLEEAATEVILAESHKKIKLFKSNLRNATESNTYHHDETFFI